MATIYKNYSVEALQLLQERLDGIAEKVYFDVRPATVDEKRKSFMVINANNRWNERNVIQYTLMTVNLFYRARQNNVMPIDKCQDMVNALLAKLPFTSGRYTFNDPYVVRICKSDGIGFGYGTVQIRCTVNTTDKF